MNRLLRLTLALVLTTMFVAGGAPSAAAKPSCCGSSCPAPKSPVKACCRPAPAGPRLAVERVSLPVVHLASAVAISVPVRVVVAVAPHRAPLVSDAASPGPTGLSPPAVLPA